MKFSKITFAGHSAIFVEGDGKSIAIDPWLEGNPLCPEGLKQPAKIDLIALTHGHSDHAGDTCRLVKHFGCQFAATYELVNLLVSEGAPSEKGIYMNKGGTVDWQGVSLTLTNALHSSSYDTASGTVYAGEPCGLILKGANHTIYHAGDTALFSDMQLIAEFYQPDIALLPIGDRFTMGPREAARAAKWVGAKLLIPIHYGTFDMLTGTVEEFRAACKAEKLDAEIVAIAPGESHSI